MSRRDWPSVMEWCRAEQEAGRLEAGQLLVVRAGETCLDHCFGRRGDGAEVDGGTIFWLASMTKPVTCAAALALVEAGLFSLRTPVRQVLPEFDGARMADGRAVGDGLTVLDLMRHTATSNGASTISPRPTRSWRGGWRRCRWPTGRARCSATGWPSTFWAG
jgi:CubicO group peptidase (beta-lactamase class C family)